MINNIMGNTDLACEIGEFAMKLVANIPRSELGTRSRVRTTALPSSACRFDVVSVVAGL